MKKKFNEALIQKAVPLVVARLKARHSSVAKTQMTKVYERLASGLAPMNVTETRHFASPTGGAPGTTPIMMLRRRTPEEQSVLDAVAQSHGWEWVERHAELILEQARVFGDLPEPEPDA